MRAPAPLLALVLSLTACAATPDRFRESWHAQWIAVPDTSPHDFGVYHFRRTFELPAKPATFRVHVTADHRYQLFVNGERAGLGPARGDLFHWRYETYDLAPLLKQGRNVIAALVWNAGPGAPVAQITNETAFLMAGDADAERVVDTGKDWKCVRDEGYDTERHTIHTVHGYYSAGIGEQVDASRIPWGWEQPDYDDSNWKQAVPFTPGSPRYSSDGPNNWQLMPRPIPMPELRTERFARIRKATGFAPVPKEGFAPLVVPPNTKATLLVDNGVLTTAYPELIVSGGAGARVWIGYAEALYVPGTHRKDNRNEVEGKEFRTDPDIFLPDGGAKRMFRPLWWRAYRYVQVEVTTKSEPLTIDDLRGTYTGYPFERKARLEGGPEDLQKILDTGWRTARLCAHETYMDCPYYEQLQYVGDTRIQALVSLYMSGDSRLMRNAIEQLHSSRDPEGLTLSRAPSHIRQYIPPFSLWWIGMVHDYWMYQDDPLFVRSMLPGVRSVLAFFAAHQKEDASLGRVPWWNFVDWAQSWKTGVPPGGVEGGSALLDLQLLLAYQWAAQLENAMGSKALAGEYQASASALSTTIQKLYWDESRKFYADTAKHETFSQHAQALAVLGGLVKGDAAHQLMERTLAEPSLTRCSIYFRYYLHEAERMAGSGDHYLDQLDFWRQLLALGLTTWAEEDEPSRSDCHAWGASPNVELFRLVLGIDTAAPGFHRVRIAPALGRLRKIAGSIPHPKGEIAVNYVRDGDKLNVTVTLPAGVEGEFVWQGQHRLLHSGTSQLRL